MSFLVGVCGDVHAQYVYIHVQISLTGGGLLARICRTSPSAPMMPQLLLTSKVVCVVLGLAEVDDC